MDAQIRNRTRMEVMDSSNGGRNRMGAINGNQDDERMEDFPASKDKKAENLGTDLQDEPASKGVIEHIKNALLLLKQLPAPERDPMSIVPKEADYYEHLSKDGSTTSDKLFGTKKQDASKYYAEARRELNIAWSIVERQTHSVEKVNILSAVGEIAFREGDYLGGKSNYTRALHILEKLVGKDNMRVADLNVKICICLEAAGNANEAIAYCNEAKSIYQARLKKLIAESGQSSFALNDPFLEKRKLEKRKLTSILSDLVFKLDDLKEHGRASPGKPVEKKSALQLFLREQLRGGGSKRR